MRVLSRDVAFGHRLVPAGVPEAALPTYGLTEDDLKAAKAFLVEVPVAKIGPAAEVETAPPAGGGAPMVAPPGRPDAKPDRKGGK